MHGLQSLHVPIVCIFVEALARVYWIIVFNYTRPFELSI